MQRREMGQAKAKKCRILQKQERNQKSLCLHTEFIQQAAGASNSPCPVELQILHAGVPSAPVATGEQVRLFFRVPNP